MVANTRAATLFHVDDFESGTVEGWSGATPSNQATGGPLGADDNFLQLNSTGFIGPASKMSTFNALPVSDWTGDYATAGVENVTVNMMVPASSPSLDMRLVLFGPTSTDNRWTSTDSMAVPNDGVWRNYSFSVAEADLTFVPLLPSSATYSEMITNVLRVMLRHDPGPPSPQGIEIEATLGIDNVTLNKLFTPGDFDIDGDVDGFDFLEWQSGFGDVYDAADLADWETNSGINSGLMAARTVPEPSAASIIMTAMLVVPPLIRRLDQEPANS